MKKLLITHYIVLVILMIFIASCAEKGFDRGAVIRSDEDNKSTDVFMIQNYKFKITFVKIDKSYDVGSTSMHPYNPQKSPENDSVLIIKLKMVEGNLNEFTKLDQWIINEKGEKNIKADMTSLITRRDEYVILFNVPKSSINLKLVIAGTEIDLSKYLLK